MSDLQIELRDNPNSINPLEQKNDRLIAVGPLSNIPVIVAYFKRVGATPRSIRTAVIEEQSVHIDQYARDAAIIRFDESGEVTVPDEYRPTDVEQAAIVEACNCCNDNGWPTLYPIDKMNGASEELLDAPDHHKTILRDFDGIIVVVEVRVNDGSINKQYIS